MAAVGPNHKWDCRKIFYLRLENFKKFEESLVAALQSRPPLFFRVSRSPRPKLTTRPHASTRSDLVTRYLLSLSGRCSRLDCFGLGARGRNSGSSFSWGGISSSSRGNLRSYTCTSVSDRCSPWLANPRSEVSFGRGSTYPCASRYPSHARAGYRSSGPCETPRLFARSCA